MHNGRHRLPLLAVAFQLVPLLGLGYACWASLAAGNSRLDRALQSAVVFFPLGCTLVCWGGGYWYLGRIRRLLYAVMVGVGMCALIVVVAALIGLFALASGTTARLPEVWLLVQLSWVALFVVLLTVTAVDAGCLAAIQNRRRAADG
jgi:hypothetical protein